MNRFRVWDKALKTYNLNDFYINADGKLFRLSVDGKLLTVHSDRFIVERCTGLTDKNGKLIFEGDVVQFSYFDYNGKDYHIVGIIEYEMFGLIIKGIKGEHFEDFTGCKNGEGKMYLECWLGEFSFDPENDFEIIGNVHKMEVKNE